MDRDRRIPDEGPELARAVRAVAGPEPTTLDLDGLRRAGRRRARRRAAAVGGGALLGVALVAAAAWGIVQGSPEDEQPVIVSPDTTTPEAQQQGEAEDRAEEERQGAAAVRCVAAGSGISPSSERAEASAVATVEELLAARARGVGAERCATPESLESLEAPSADLLATGMRGPDFESPYTPEEDDSRATRPVAGCLYFDDCDDAIVDAEIVESEPRDESVAVADVSVRLTTASGRAIGEVHHVAWVSVREPGEPEEQQLLVERVSTAPPSTLFVDAERVVADYLAALAANRYDQAAVWFASPGGTDPQSRERAEGRLDERLLDEFLEAVPGFAESGENEALLASFCGPFGGTCRPLLDVVSVEHDGLWARVTFTMDDGSGNPVRVDGTTTFELGVFWFEGLLGTSGAVPTPVPDG